MIFIGVSTYLYWGLTVTSNHPFNIKTKAGQLLWADMNNHYGSSVWGPVGRGIEEVEAEVQEKIIKLLNDNWTIISDKSIIYLDQLIVMMKEN